MVAAVRRGQSQRAVARRFGVGLGHLQYWLARTRGQKLARVEWSDQSCAPRRQGRQTTAQLQRRILALRRELRRSDLGFVGAQAIHERSGAPVFYHRGDEPYYTGSGGATGLRKWLSDQIPEVGVMVLAKGLLGESTPRPVSATTYVNDGDVLVGGGVAA